jgi:hypothetical protein
MDTVYKDATPLRSAMVSQRFKIGSSEKLATKHSDGVLLRGRRPFVLYGFSNPSIGVPDYKSGTAGREWREGQTAFKTLSALVLWFNVFLKVPQAGITRLLFYLASSG